MSCREWTTFLLGETCEYSKDKVEIDKVTLKNYISTENMLPDKGGITVASTIPDAKSVPAYSEGDVLISNIRPYFKKIWYADISGGASSDVLVFKGHKDKIINRYLYYLLSQDNFFDYVMGSSKGTKMPRGDKSAILRYSVKLPTLKEQNIIASILGTLDEKIETNNKINKTLEEMAQAIFKRWFIDFEFPNENGEPYKSSGGEMVESEMRLIPANWSIGALGDIATISSGKRPYEKSREKDAEFTIPLVGASSIMGYVKEYNYNEPILVIGRVGTHGIVQRFENKVWASDNTLVIKSQYYEYVSQILMNIDYTLLNRGSTQPLITQTDIKNEKIILADKDVFENFEKLVGSLRRITTENNKQNEKLTNIRDSFLPKLMSGEIRVPLKE